MRKVREVIRLKESCGRSHREISAAIGIAQGSVFEYLSRARRAGLTWADVEKLTDSEVEARLFVQVGRNEPPARVAIDYAWVAREMRSAGVTLQLLWVEYREGVQARGGDARAYQYSQFCDLYRAWRKKLPLVMRQEHRAGERAFVDYSGKKPCIVDRETGEFVEVELFLMVLGASSYTYAEATLTQSLGDFVGSHIRAFEYYERAPGVLVPDQLKSAVRRADWLDPDINATYSELAKHYGIAVIPARPRKPRDKAKVEVGVQIAQRWILARLRNRIFFSLAELNAAIAELLEDLNTRPFKKLEGCRRSAFETIDRPAMKPLPAERYVIVEWKHATVNIDYHVEYDDRLYSVHHTLTRKAVEICATATTVEILHDRKRVASHVRSYGPKGSAVTSREHRPKSHRDYGDWPPSRVIGWAGAIGPNTAAVVERILASRPHPEQGYRACMALIRGGKQYGRERTEAACARALAIGSPSRKSVEMILKRGLDRVAGDDAATTRAIGHHEHIRGGDYYDTQAAPSSPSLSTKTIH
jgi:transposase